MSCTDPILSFEALIQRAVKYSAGCAVLKYAETAEESAFTCAEADIPDLVLLAMAFDSGANVFRVAIAPADLSEICDNYSLRMECDGVTAAQALRETVTVDEGIATIRVLFIGRGEVGSCHTDCAERGLEDLIGATVVTDGTDSYIVAIAPEESPDELSCVDADVGSQAFLRGALTEVGSCGRWAWRIEEGELGGDFNDDFSNDFNI